MIEWEKLEEFEPESKEKDPLNDGYEYIQDEYGRTISARGNLEYGESKRNYSAQLEAGGEYRRETDEGGHLIGYRFGGSGDAENLVAENQTLNRSGFKVLENEWTKELERGNEVFVDIRPEYQDGTERPHSIWGEYMVSDIDGNETRDYFSFTNENLESKEFELPEEADEMLDDYEECGGETND